MDRKGFEEYGPNAGKWDLGNLVNMDELSFTTFPTTGILPGLPSDGDLSLTCIFVLTSVILVCFTMILICFAVIPVCFTAISVWFTLILIFFRFLLICFSRILIYFPLLPMFPQENRVDEARAGFQAGGMVLILAVLLPMDETLELAGQHGDCSIMSNECSHNR
eukprot:g37823.t1